MDNSKSIEVTFKHWIVVSFRVLTYIYLATILVFIFALVIQRLLFEEIILVTLLLFGFIVLWFLYANFLSLKIVADTEKIEIYHGRKIDKIKWDDVIALRDVPFLKNLVRLQLKNNVSIIILKNIHNYTKFVEYISVYAKEAHVTTNQL